jgi:ribosomal protein L31
LDIFLFLWTKQRTMIKSYGSAARFNVRFGNPHSKFY